MENALFRVIIGTTVPQKGKGTQWLMNCTKQTIIDFTALKGKKKKPWIWVIQMEQNEKKKVNCHRTNRLQIRADRQ